MRFRKLRSEASRLSYETVELSADAGLNITVYTAEVGSASQDALDILASWSATLDQSDTADVSDEASRR